MCTFACRYIGKTKLKNTEYIWLRYRSQLGFKINLNVQKSFDRQSLTQWSGFEPRSWILWCRRRRRSLCCGSPPRTWPWPTSSAIGSATDSGAERTQSRSVNRRNRTPTPVNRSIDGDTYPSWKKTGCVLQKVISGYWKCQSKLTESNWSDKFPCLFL